MASRNIKHLRKQVSQMALPFLPWEAPTLTAIRVRSLDDMTPGDTTLFLHTVTDKVFRSGEARILTLATVYIMARILKVTKKTFSFEILEHSQFPSDLTTSELSKVQSKVWKGKVASKTFERASKNCPVWRTAWHSEEARKHELQGTRDTNDVVSSTTVRAPQLNSGRKANQERAEVTSITTEAVRCSDVERLLAKMGRGEPRKPQSDSLHASSEAPAAGAWWVTTDDDPEDFGAARLLPDDDVCPDKQHETRGTNSSGQNKPGRL